MHAYQKDATDSHCWKDVMVWIDQYYIYICVCEMAVSHIALMMMMVMMMMMMMITWQ
jgi:hypothetical protein